MHALCAYPELFSGAILVSAHSGMPENALEERAARKASDEAWARRFESAETWEPLLGDWNAQGVFAGGSSLNRAESRYDRAVLAGQLRKWSLGRQGDLLPRLAEVSAPILWIAGEQDLKFAHLARKTQEALGRRSSAEFWIAPEAGHRVPWDQPELFKKRVQDWIFRTVLGR